MKFISIIFVLPLLMINVPIAEAGGFNGLGVGFKAGSLGMGIEVAKSITEKLNVRGAFQSFPYSYDGELTEQEMEYTVDFKLGSWSVLLDYHPTTGTFYFAGGLVGNNNEIEGTIMPMKARTIGSRTYSVEEQGSLTPLITWPSMAPYIGIGFGRPTEKGFGWFMDIGAMMQGSPEVTMTGTGMMAPSVRNAAQLEEDLSGATTWLVVAIGFKFGLL